VRGRYSFWVAAEDHVMTESCDHGDSAPAAAAASERSPGQPPTAGPLAVFGSTAVILAAAGKLDR
jgi:hypothetical protein